MAQMVAAPRRRRFQSDMWLGYALVAPAILLILAVAIYPLFTGIWYSFLHYDLEFTPPGTTDFVGLRNYQHLLQDARFWSDLWTTLYFTIATVAIETVLGLVFALVIHRKFPGRGLMRAAVLVPWAIPTIITAQIWKWMWNDQLGVINAILQQLHILRTSVVWLGNPATSLPAIIITDVWKTTPFMALLILAGLQVISDDLYEAARIDGASAWQAFWSVTLPLLRPSLTVALIFRTLQAFQVFDVIYALTQGASGTESLGMYDQEVWQQLQISYSSTISVAIFVVILVISGIYIRVLGQQETN